MLLLQRRTMQGVYGLLRSLSRSQIVIRPWHSMASYFWGWQRLCSDWRSQVCFTANLEQGMTVRESVICSQFMFTALYWWATPPITVFSWICSSFGFARKHVEQYTHILEQLCHTRCCNKRLSFALLKLINWCFIEALCPVRLTRWLLQNAISWNSTVSQ